MDAPPRALKPAGCLSQLDMLHAPMHRSTPRTPATPHCKGGVHAQKSKGHANAGGVLRPGEQIRVVRTPLLPAMLSCLQAPGMTPCISHLIQQPASPLARGGPKQGAHQSPASKEAPEPMEQIQRAAPLRLEHMPPPPHTNEARERGETREPELHTEAVLPAAQGTRHERLVANLPRFVNEHHPLSPLATPPPVALQGSPGPPCARRSLPSLRRLSPRHRPGLPGRPHRRHPNPRHLGGEGGGWGSATRAMSMYMYVYVYVYVCICICICICTLG